MKNNQKHLSLNIQRFADDGTNADVTTVQNVTQNTSQQENQSVIDYNKIQSMIDSRNSKTEDSILKSYFQTQGLSEDEMKQAISSFKTQREENSKNQVLESARLQDDLKVANDKLLRGKIEKEAILQSLDLNIDSKTIPYVIKLADLSSVTDDKGTVNTEAVKSALQKVLEDIPGLKRENPNLSNLKIGADSFQNSESNIDSTLSKIFGTKK